MTLSEKDQKAACALIARKLRLSRKRAARVYRKSITTRLSNEEGRQLSVNTEIIYDPKTDYVTSATHLKYCRVAIYPGTKHHLSCYDQTGIDYLMKERERGREYYQKNKQ